MQAEGRASALCLSCLTMLSVAPAAIADAMSDHDNSPLSGIFSIPDSTEGATLLAEGTSGWSVVLLTSSHSVAEASGNETLILDGETTRAEWLYRYGINARMEIGIEIPYLWHQSGGLDSIIDGWHGFFGFPDGPRDDRPQDVLEFRYQVDAADQLNVSENSHGFGDIRLFGGWQLSGNREHRTALRFGAKIPTGSADELHGSGGVDVNFGIAGDIQSLWGREKLDGFYRANVSYLGEPEWLPDRYENVVGQLSGGLDYRVSSNVGLTAQATFRSRLYDAAVENLGESSVMLTVGARINLSDRWQLALAVGEDVKVGSVPDVTFQLGLQYRPH